VRVEGTVDGRAFCGDGGGGFASRAFFQYSGEEDGLIILNWGRVDGGSGADGDWGRKR